MKITEIHLKNFLHFKKNLKLNLTYPVGHELAGQPLKKICFLGQSGTGKTTLLNLIKHFISQGQLSNSGFEVHKMDSEAIELFFNINEDKYSQIPGESRNTFQFKDIVRANQPVFEDIGYFNKLLQTSTKDCKPLLISFPFNIVKAENHIESSSSPKDTIKFTPSTGEIENVDITNKKYWDFTASDLQHIWDLVFNAIEHYVNEFETKKLESFDAIRSLPEKATEIFTAFAEWEASNPNPIEKIAHKCLNPILNKFSLEVETDISKYRIDVKDRSYIIIKNQTNNEEIQYPFLSTGTKQIMLTAIPLFFIEPKNCIILFDQPETSLYPNIQYLLPETYNSIAPEGNQFFYATHSPIVASSFEPWEIVELKFDSSTGTVERKEYHTGERHIDNYFINPQLLKWDSSYKLLFDLEHLSNEERSNKLVELSMLEKRIKKESNHQAKVELYKDYKILAQQLDWPDSDAEA